MKHFSSSLSFLGKNRYKLFFFLSASEKSSVTSSIILKFGPGVKPDPTKPFQNHLRRNLGRLPGPVNLKTLIQSVRIVHPGKFLHKYVKVNESIPWF